MILFGFTYGLKPVPFTGLKPVPFMDSAFPQHVEPS